jgi:leucyl-tRNA synthetase
MRYNPKDIEGKWQKAWAESQVYAARDFGGERKFMMLTEFPYPSGAGLHMGHLREYTLGDVIARQKRMLGYNVMFPMGYDAFGLPTENYAIKNKISPQRATEENVASFRRTLDMMGYSIDWGRSFSTTDPEYYRWTQWLFLQMYKTGLAYQDEIDINWCPFCKTGLANEEVVNGRHERCETVVEKKTLKQWMLRITDYADRLIEGLRTVDYPARIADQQVNWIGRSVGAEVEFKVEGRKDVITVFTTRPDTLFGATFMVLAPEHEVLAKITTEEQREKVNEYIKRAQSKSEIERQENKEKTGVFTGAYAINPVNGERVPIWVADYVLMGYGTGAIMAVPGHDERDWEFARKFKLPILEVISGGDVTEAAYVGDGTLVNSGYLDGLSVEEAKKTVVERLAKDGTGREKVQYKLRDWIFSRQHYWGEPIPIIHCPEHGAVPVPEEELPVELPVVDHYEPTDTGESPLAAISDWVNTTCPICGKPARRETDTMPNWAGSDWYYLRYMDARNNEKFADAKKLKYWLPVDLYLGGMEHTTLHLLYSRFWHQFLYDQKLVPTAEPYAARRAIGIVLAADGRKMSKSYGNVVDPVQIIESGYGADATRLAAIFIAPYDQTTPWSPEGVAGCYRFLARVWSLAETVDLGNTKSDAAAERVIHKLVKKVTEDLARMSFNTAVAAMMEAVNELNRVGISAMTREDLGRFTQVLAPFAPHLAEEIWREVLGERESVHLSKWPVFDKKLVADATVRIGVQVNGKLRGEIEVEAKTTEAEALKLAGADANVKNYIEGKTPKKVIYVAGRILNIIV